MFTRILCFLFGHIEIFFYMGKEGDPWSSEEIVSSCARCGRTKKL